MNNLKTINLVLAVLTLARSVTFAHIGETEDQVRGHFKSPPIDQGGLTFHNTDEPEAKPQEGAYLIFLENGWLVAVEFCEGKSVIETWSKTSAVDWTSKPIPSQDIENLRKEYGMDEILPGLWGNATVWMRYDEHHNAVMIAPYDFIAKPATDVWPRLPTWWYLEKARELDTTKSEVLPGKTPLPVVAVATATPSLSVAARTATPVTREFPLRTAPAPSQAPKRLTLVQIAAKISPSVVALTAYNSEGEKLKTGTGFFVHQSGVIATDWHVISGANRVTARTATGEVLEVVVILRYDPKLDLALCGVSQTEGSNFPSLDKFTEPPQMGIHIAVLGNPEGLEQCQKVLCRQFGTIAGAR